MQKNPRTILIADNDEAARKSLSEFFLDQGYRVETTPSASEVIQRIQNETVDALIMAVELIGIKGYEVAAILKKIDPELPVIMISDDSSIELAKKVRQAGIFFYEMKPVDFEEMRLVVEDAFVKRSRAEYGAVNTANILYEGELRMKGLMKRLETFLMAATFAEAGEFETAKEYLRKEGLCQEDGLKPIADKKTTKKAGMLTRSTSYNPHAGKGLKRYKGVVMPSPA